ncbi:DoxX family protein [Nitrosomonas sp. HPC101]|uniref:DoxX family protein n=1 Tax=Nitrosomonas sp. HPC101 TaxID=1658667 RepID=UPI0013708006|nr:DoxX family protein [Nitrosomonas sp. HPC101]MXS86484.1 DoxX family protein [Nitrosomonas sp. HPC101]
MKISAILKTHAKTDLAMLLLRVTTGGTFMAHGAQKLFGWFGGHGLEATGQWMSSIGLDPGFLMAFLAGAGEFFGGLALLLGILTRPAALGTALIMLVAMFAVHWTNGFFITNSGYEYAFTLMMISICILLHGAGKYSLDHTLQTMFSDQPEK